MIARLRRRLMLLVVAVLILVTAGIVLSIDAMNRRNITTEARAALSLLAENRGQRPQPPVGSSAPGGSGTGTGTGSVPGGLRGAGGMQRDRLGRRGLDVGGSNSLAFLSNTYTILISGDGSVSGWSSDRAGLYADEDIQSMAEAILAGGASEGRVGTQYYRVSEESATGSRLLIVLDARLEFLSAQRSLRATAIVAALACLLLSAAACVLIARMLKPVEQSFERQKQFVWDASHEFKTPLAVISANCEVLEAEVGENEYLGYIQSEVRRTDRLVQNLLTLARMDKGTVKAELRRINLSEALLEVALPFESTVFEAGKTLELDVGEDVSVKGDADMLKQLAVILLSNALKYSDDGGTIRLSLAQKGRGAVLTVYNTGEGIPRDKLEKIFDRFYRGDDSHNSEIAGNGLGLSIARTIAEAHKGRIHAESTPGQGAAFIVTLP